MSGARWTRSRTFLLSWINLTQEDADADNVLCKYRGIGKPNALDLQEGQTEREQGLGPRRGNNVWLLC